MSGSTPLSSSLDQNLSRFPKINKANDSLSFTTDPSKQCSLKKIVDFLKAHQEKIAPDRETLAELQDFLSHQIEPSKSPKTRRKLSQVFLNIHPKPEDQIAEEAMHIVQSLLVKIDLKSFEDKLNAYQTVVEQLENAYLQQEFPSNKPSNEIEYLEALFVKAEKGINQILIDLKNSKNLTPSSMETLALTYAIYVSQSRCVKLKSRDQSIKRFFIPPDILTKITQESLLKNIPLICSSLVLPFAPIKITSTPPSIDLNLDDFNRFYQLGKDLYSTENEGVEMTISSAYPLKKELREGDPVADDMRLLEFQTEDGGSVLIFSGADGCGWGINQAKAAQDANKGFIDHCVKQLSKSSPKNTSSVILTGILSAQNSIKNELKVRFPNTSIEEFESLKQIATTTHIGMIIKKNPDGGASAILSNIGDLKVFLIKYTGRVIDITEGNRQGQNPTDPGGRISSDFIEARNLALYSFDLDIGDILIPMSDGIHDNLNPQLQFNSPQELLNDLFSHQEKIDSSSLTFLKRLNVKRLNWNQCPLHILEKLNTIYMGVQIQTIICNEDKKYCLSERLINYAYSMSEASRKFLETHPHVKLPNDVSQFPGKMDHLCCAVIYI